MDRPPSSQRLCLHLIRIGKCIFRDTPNRICVYNHDVNLDGILGNIRRFLSFKHLKAACRVLNSMANPESPWKNVLFSELGTQITEEAMDALLKDYYSDLTEPILSLMTNGKFKFMPKFVDFTITRVVSAQNSQQFEIIGYYISVLAQRCEFENFKISPFCLGKILWLYVQLGNFDCCLKTVDKLTECSVEWDPISCTPEVLEFLFDKAKLDRDKLGRLCLALQRFGKRALNVLGLQRGAEILKRMRDFRLFLWHDLYSGVISLAAISTPPMQPSLQLHPHQLVSETQPINKKRQLSTERISVAEGDGLPLAESSTGAVVLPKSLKGPSCSICHQRGHVMSRCKAKRDSREQL